MPWNNSHRFLVAFQSADGSFGFHRLVLRFIGTLNTSVETSASEKAATDTPRIEVACVFRLAKTIAKTRQEGIRIGITLPKGTNQSLLDAHVVFLRKLTDDRMNKRVRPEFRARRKPSDS